MLVALTGATGFIGRYLVDHLLDEGHELRCSHRADSDRSGYDAPADRLEWFETELNDGNEHTFVDGCDAVIHAALYHPGGGFRGGEGDLIEFAQRNLIGSLRLIEAAYQNGVGRFVLVSTCAVHEEILDDRPLDETHPLWPKSHYGAHKAALEKFVHSYGLGHGYSICALRPTGVYGIARPIEKSKWYDLVQSVAEGAPVTCEKGGKEVHAADVAKAAGLLLKAEGVAGEAYNCYDRYVSQWDVAHLAKTISGSDSKIAGKQPQPKHQIETGKLRALGMEFGGEALLRQTVEELVQGG